MSDELSSYSKNFEERFLRAVGKGRLKPKPKKRKVVGEDGQVQDEKEPDQKQVCATVVCRRLLGPYAAALILVRLASVYAPM